MNVKKIKSRKALKLLGLLISSLFIATASATYYAQMFMYAHVTVAGQYVKFVSAGNTTDLTGSIISDGAEVTFDNMIGYNGSLASWSEAVNITNFHASQGYNVTLAYHDWNGYTEDTLRYINITMYDGDAQKGEMLTLVPGGNNVTTSGKQVLSASGMWRVQWDIFYWPNATTAEAVDVTLKLIVEE